MTRERRTVDTELLLIQMLSRDMPTGTEVAASPDVDMILNLPMVIVQPTGFFMVPDINSSLQRNPTNSRKVWQWTVSFTIFDNTIDGASETADILYGLLHDYADDSAGIPGVGRIIGTEDLRGPIRSSTTKIGAESITQFDGTFTLFVSPFNR